MKCQSKAVVGALRQDHEARAQLRGSNAAIRKVLCQSLSLAGGRVTRREGRQVEPALLECRLQHVPVHLRDARHVPAEGEAAGNGRRQRARPNQVEVVGEDGAGIA